MQYYFNLMKRLLILFFLASTIAQAQLADPLVFNEKTHDFGPINEDGGNVATEFKFVNKSGRPIKIVNVQPSCGCTTPDWTRDIIEDGASGIIKASFDPRGKAGYFNKSITVTTDLNSSPIILAIKGNVEGKTDNNEYDVRNGALLTKVSTFNIGKIFINKDNGFKSFDIKNGGKIDLTFGAIKAPDYITVQLPQSIKPGEKSNLLLFYDAQKKNSYGFVSDNIEIATNDPAGAIKSFSVFATIEEYFPSLTAKAIEEAPVLNLENQEIKFGQLSQNAIFNHEIVVKNSGQSTLLIRALQPNCSCLEAKTEKVELKPGTSSTIKITFAPKGRPGIQNKSIAVYSNDPRNPVQRITLAGVVR